MFPFPYYTLQELKSNYPSKKHGRTWKTELNYRNDCIQIILACGPPIKLLPSTLHKAVVLLHRYFTRYSSSERSGLDKWAMATACVFLATKVDSTYTRLESVVHVSFRALRQMQDRQMEAEYFNPDGSPGNPVFLANLSHLVRDAEIDLIFAINFDFNIEVPAVMVVNMLNELGLTAAAAQQDSRLDAARTLAVKYGHCSISSPRALCCLMFDAREISLAAISAACKCYGYPLRLDNIPINGYTPAVTAERLAAAERALPKLSGDSRAESPAVTDAGGSSSSKQPAGALAPGGDGGAPGVSGAATNTMLSGSFPGGAAGVSAGVSALLKGGGSGKGAHDFAGLSLGDGGSSGEAFTAGPRLNKSPISPDIASSAAAGQGHEQQRKRLRAEGGLGQVLLMGSEPVQKKGCSVVAA